VSSIDPIYKKWKNLIEPNLPASMSSDIVAAEYASWHSVLQDWSSGFCSTTLGPHKRLLTQLKHGLVLVLRRRATALEDGDPPPGS
jgi:hypothetical protein